MKKTKITSTNTQKGVSLIEILIVILIFSIIGVLITNAIFLTLRGTQKSQSMMKIRERMNYVVSVIQRQIRGAQKISECPNSDLNRIEYFDESGNLSSFSCNIVEGTGYIASGSARLTSDDINITACSFTCEESVSGNPPTVSISLSANDSQTNGVVKGRATFTTKIILRNN